MSVKNSDFSKIIKATRKKAGLTQLELSELAGVGKTLVFDLEKGHENVTLANLLKVCRVLNIKVQVTPPMAVEKK